MLLRERLGRRARVKARPVIDREPPNRLVQWLENYLPNRTGIALTVLMLLGSTTLGVVKGGHVDELVAALSEAATWKRQGDLVSFIGTRPLRFRLNTN